MVSYCLMAVGMCVVCHNYYQYIGIVYMHYTANGRH